MTNDNIKVLLTAVVLIVIFALIGPFLLIWSVNTLFALEIAYGFFEWLAAFFLLGFFKAKTIYSPKT